MHKRFPGNELLGLRFPALLSPAILDAAHAGDSLIAAQRIAGAMAHHYHLPVASIVVRFDEKLESAARIYITSDDICMVEMQERYRASRKSVAILAHEVAHLFLERAGLRYADTFENEVLTDTASVYLGAGWSVLNAYSAPSVSRSEEQVGFRTTRVTTTTTSAAKLGYLTPEEFGYVLARRCEVTNERVRHWLTRMEGRTALKEGEAKVRRERTSPPLLQAGFFSRARYRCAVWLARRGSSGHERVTRHGDFSIEVGEKKRVLFRCPVCTQQLRLPVGLARVSVTCAICKQSFDCAS